MSIVRFEACDRVCPWRSKRRPVAVRIPMTQVSVWLVVASLVGYVDELAIVAWETEIAMGGVAILGEV